MRVVVGENGGQLVGWGGRGCAPVLGRLRVFFNVRQGLEDAAARSRGSCASFEDKEVGVGGKDDGSVAGVDGRLGLLLFVVERVGGLKLLMGNDERLESSRERDEAGA